MHKSLDLCIEPTASVENVPPEVVATIALRYDQLDLSHAGDPLRDPLTPRERRDIRLYLEEYWMWPYEEFAQRSAEVEALLVEVGRRLYLVVRKQCALCRPGVHW
jgi:hypothetical protein